MEYNNELCHNFLLHYIEKAYKRHQQNTLKIKMNNDNTLLENLKTN